VPQISPAREGERESRGRSLVRGRQPRVTRLDSRMHRVDSSVHRDIPLVCRVQTRMLASSAMVRRSMFDVDRGQISMNRRRTLEARVAKLVFRVPLWSVRRDCVTFPLADTSFRRPCVTVRFHDSAARAALRSVRRACRSEIRRLHHRKSTSTRAKDALTSLAMRFTPPSTRFTVRVGA